METFWNLDVSFLDCIWLLLLSLLILQLPYEKHCEWQKIHNSFRFFVCFFPAYFVLLSFLPMCASSINRFDSNSVPKIFGLFIYFLKGDFGGTMGHPSTLSFFHPLCSFLPAAKPSGPRTVIVVVLVLGEGAVCLSMAYLCIYCTIFWLHKFTSGW